MVYLPTSAVAVVEDWLLIRGRKPGPLLCPIRKGKKVELRQLTPQAVLWIVKKRAQEAGVELFSPHDFRRTFCSDLLDCGTDIVTVQKLAGLWLLTQSHHPERIRLAPSPYRPLESVMDGYFVPDNHQLEFLQLLLNL